LIERRLKTVEETEQCPILLTRVVHDHWNIKELRLENVLLMTVVAV